MLPVSVLLCAMGAPPIPTSNGSRSGPPTPIIGRTLSITFRNDGAAVLREVAFSVVHDGARFTIVDRGRFSPGVIIAHQFSVLQADSSLAGEAACTVTDQTHFPPG